MSYRRGSVYMGFNQEFHANNWFYNEHCSFDGADTVFK
jgi:hypothetical protein